MRGRPELTDGPRLCGTLLFFAFAARAVTSPFRFKADGGHAGHGATARPWSLGLDLNAESAPLDLSLSSLRIAWTSLSGQKR
jgi:hypothetical protein